MTRQHDEGFTLIELLMSVAIIVIVISAITAALITFLQNGSYASARDDHSGGAVVLSTYLNRDLASAESVAVSPASPCGGSAPAATVLTLQWSEWTATVASPSPTPSPLAAGGTAFWRASYVVTTDPAPPVGVGTRYQLERRLCTPGSSSPDSSLLVRNLKPTTAGSAATAVSVTAGAATTACPAGTFSLKLPSYADDAASQSFTYSGCLKGRVG